MVRTNIVISSPSPPSAGWEPREMGRELVSTWGKRELRRTTRQTMTAREKKFSGESLCRHAYKQKKDTERAIGRQIGRCSIGSRHCDVTRWCLVHPCFCGLGISMIRKFRQHQAFRKSICYGWLEENGTISDTSGTNLSNGYICQSTPHSA